MEEIEKLIKEWHSNREMQKSYPDGLKQFLIENVEIHESAYDYIAKKNIKPSNTISGWQL